MVSGVNVVNVKHLLGTDVTEHSDLLNSWPTNFCEHLQAIISGINPRDLRSFIAALSWLSLLFAVNHRNQRDMNQHEFSLPTLTRASINGALSISRTVPPSSMIDTSGSIPVSSTGILDIF